MDGVLTDRVYNAFSFALAFTPDVVRGQILHATRQRCKRMECFIMSMRRFVCYCTSTHAVTASLAACTHNTLLGGEKHSAAREGRAQGSEEATTAQVLLSEFRRCSCKSDCPTMTILSSTSALGEGCPRRGMYSQLPLPPQPQAHTREGGGTHHGKTTHAPRGLEDLREGVMAPSERARRVLTAARTDPAAAHRLAGWYRGGKEGLHQSPGLAFRWELRAAKRGHVKAQGRVASAYNTGSGVAADHVAATAWFGKAASRADRAEGHGVGDADNDDDNKYNSSFSPLLDLVERFPDLFEREVLRRLRRIDRTFLAQAGSACRAAVAASDLPRAGTRQVVRGKSVWRVTHKLSKFCTSVERLAWAKINGWPYGCPWTGLTCSLAAAGGHLTVLQWAREHGCPWNDFTCFWAALDGHLDVLRWAREHDCPWDKRDCKSASRDHPETLAWVRAQQP